MRLNSLPLRTLLTLSCLGIAPLAQADLILDLGPGGSPASCGGCGVTGTVLGWSFIVNNAIVIDGIGVWDSQSAPLGATTEAGIFDNTGNLLASAVISDSSMPVASASGDGQWLFKSIAPITLVPGFYETGNVFFNSEPVAEINSPLIVNPDITVFGGVIGPLNIGFAAPLGTFPQLVFGPTFETAPVPEPGLAGLFGFGLGAMLLRLARAKKHRALSNVPPLA